MKSANAEITLNAMIEKIFKAGHIKFYDSVIRVPHCKNAPDKER